MKQWLNMKSVNIGINENLWKSLTVLKWEFGVSTFNEVVQKLYESYIKEVKA